MRVNSDRYRVSSEVPTLELEVDRPLVQAEREALEHFLSGCREHAWPSDSEGLAVAIDVALGELGGEENICAG